MLTNDVDQTFLMNGVGSKQSGESWDWNTFL